MMKQSFDEDLDLIPLDDEYFPSVDDELDIIPLDFEDQNEDVAESEAGQSHGSIEGLFGDQSNEPNGEAGIDDIQGLMQDQGLDQSLLEGQQSQEQPQEESFAQKIASNPITQGLLGAAKYFTWPLDVLKMAMVGEGLTDLDEIENAFERAGKPFDREDYVNKVLELGESMPTQQLLENIIKEYTGIDLEPKDTASKILRSGAEILSTGPKGLIKEPAKQIAKRTAGALAGGATSEGLKAVGTPQTLADVIGFAIGGAAGGKGKPVNLSPEAQKLAQTAEKHGLRQFEGMSREVAPKNPVVSTAKQAQLTKELSETSRQAIDKVIEGKLPIKKLRDSGVNLETAYTAAYDQAYNTAKKFDLGSNKEIDLGNLMDFIKDKKQKIKASAPSLSSTDKTLLKEMDKQYTQLSSAPKKQATILGPNGQPIPQSAKRIPKKTTAEQALDQYKNFNEEVRGIYRKPEFSGSENAVKNFYGELNSKLIDSIEKASPELANELRFANRIFSQTSNLDLAEGIMSKAFKDGYNPKKLVNVLGGKTNKSMLERSLGKDAVKDLVDIAAYGTKAEEKVLSQLKNPKTMGQFLSEMSPLKLGLLSLKHGLNYKFFGLPLAYDLSKSLVNRAQGALFTRPATRKTYVNYLKHAMSPQSAAFKKASKDLTDSILNEFGGEDDFMQYLEELDQEE